MSNNYVIGRSQDCNIIPNATKEPIHLGMHHFNSRSLIVNVKTGDILTHLFSDGSSSAQSCFDNSGINQLEHETFLKQDGQKFLFVLKTNHSCPNINKYIKDITAKDVIFAGDMVSDIINECPDYNQYRYGEIYTGFIIDLKKPSIFKTIHSGIEASELTQNVFSEVGNAPSELPDMVEQNNNYHKHSNIGNLISWADERLPEILEQSGIDLSNLSDTPKCFTDILIKEEQLFTSEYLYSEKNADDILNTLILLKNKGLDTARLSSVCLGALSGVHSQIRYLDYNEANFDNLASQSIKILSFFLDLLNENNEFQKDTMELIKDSRFVRYTKNQIKHFESENNEESQTLLQLIDLFKLIK